MPQLQSVTESGLRAWVNALPPWVNADLAVTDTNGNLVFQHTNSPDTDQYEELSHAKLGIVHAAGLLAARQALDWNDTVTIEDHHRRGGKGVMQYLPPGYPVLFADLVGQMLKTSDNTAMVAAVETLGGPDTVNTILEQDSPLRAKIPNVRLVPDAEDAARFWCTSRITARESAVLLADLLKHPMFRTFLEHGDFTGGLRRDIEDHTGLPPGDKAWLAFFKAYHRLGLPRPKNAYQHLLDLPYRRTEYPNKEATDADSGQFHDVAQIGPYIVGLLTAGWDKKRDHPNHPAHNLQGLVGQTIKVHERA